MEEMVSRIYSLGHRITKVGEIDTRPSNAGDKNSPHDAFFTIHFEIKPKAKKQEISPRIQIASAVHDYITRQRAPATAKPEQPVQAQGGTISSLDAELVGGFKSFSTIRFTSSAEKREQLDNIRGLLIESIKRRDAESR